jgi:hypothetical protein
VNAQELNTQVEELAKSHATADTIAAFILTNVPGVAPELATQRAAEWVAWANKAEKAIAPLTALGEFERMILIFSPRCHQVHDPLEIAISPEEWAKNIARSAIELCREKEAEGTTMKIGSRVREVKVKEDADGVLLLDNGQKTYVEGYYHEGKYFEAPGKFGIVVANPAAVEAELKPFEGYEHNLDDLRIKPVVTDEQLASAEYEHRPKPFGGYPAIDDLYIDPASLEPTKAYDPQYVEFLAGLVNVQWYLADGTECEIGWHSSIELEELP